jgi:hypothetical protein
MGSLTTSMNLILLEIRNLKWSSLIVINEVYQEEELPTSFVVESDLGLNHLVGDADDLLTPEK